FLIIIVLAGFFLRAYHFSPWLHFELDQARDARVVDDALRGGPEELTLLGPKAGGTFLRLAPGFYYLQYLSGLVFGGTPVGIAFLIMLLSVASIPVFYLFIRRYFSVTLALSLTALFAVSAFFVMYGRFAWNPNILPFFLIGGMYALLCSVDTEEMNRGRWFLLAAVLLTLATHGHFLAFLAVPAITVLFLVVKRPRFSLRSWAGALLVVGALYLPMVLNEVETKGSNTKEFFAAISEKSTKEDRSLAEKFLRNTSEHALGALLITTGFEGGTFPKISLRANQPLWTCAEKCDRGKWYGVGALLLLTMSLLLLLFFWWREKEQSKKDFLLLSGLWFAVTFILFLPLSYGFAPRFLLLSGMLFVVFLGLLLVGVQKILGGGKIGTGVVIGVVLFLVAFNLFFLTGRFSELARAGTEVVDSPPDRILKERIRVTLEQQNHIVDFFEGRYREQHFPIYMFSEPQHRRALKYLLERRGIENAVLGFDGVYQEGLYFLVLRAQSDLEDALKKYRASYMVGETTPFGTLVVIELLPKPETILAKRQDFSVVQPSDSTAPPRYTWREFFDRHNQSANDQQEGSLEQTEDQEADQANQPDN
ncbi:MAG: glycosyltransferase family 39 protein, partial [Candidatus Moranbacteria bacterium]|nr:glycosyltransferase family 39 protein [Candidatus Moranbacteria bacterium]